MKTHLFTGMAAISLAASTLFGAGETALIPAPQKMERREGKFVFNQDTRIFTDSGSMDTAEFFANQFEKPSGIQLRISGKTDPGMEVTGGILITTNGADSTLGAEGYELTVETNRIVLKAPAQAGLFYGEQTLLQLLPADIFGKQELAQEKTITWTIPCLKITDQPRFKWRGLMLDVSRHFFTKDEVKQLLEAMAMHKINTFHWHLVDDQGWRIEIKKYPRLTELGAWRAAVGFGLATNSTTAYGPDGRYGGFYTQDDIREVVAYAEKLHITIVPEIEMPGHSLAALVAYPDLASGKGPFTVPLTGGVNTGIYSPAKEETFTFLDGVLAEVFQLFPGKYIHIGGDEVPKGPWKKDPACQELMKREGLKNEEELQSWFLRRIEKYVNSQGRTLIGWSEILQGGLAKNAAVMDWIGGGAEAANQGHDVVMSPTSYCYFDSYQSQDRAAEPVAIGGYIPLAKVYDFEPIPKGLAPEMQGHILGAQGNVWTEYIPNLKHVEYMAFPRLVALSEVTWSPKESRDYADFTRRLKTDYQRLAAMGVNYRVENSRQIGEWSPSQITIKAAPLEWDITGELTSAGKGMVSFNYAKGGHGIDIQWVALLENGIEIARDTHEGFAGAKPKKPLYFFDVPAPKAGATYKIRAAVRGDGGTDSSGLVFWELKPASK